MTDHKPRLVRFPPLTVAPSWATAPAPAEEDLHTLQETVRAELAHLALLQRLLSTRPAPASMQLHRVIRRPILHDVLAALRTMHYPAEWTGWIDTVRTLARRAADELDCCYEAIEWLKWSTAGTPEHRQYLGTAQRSIQLAHQHAGTLYNQFAQLPAPDGRVTTAPAGRVIQLTDRLRLTTGHVALED